MGRKSKRKQRASRLQPTPEVKRLDPYILAWIGLFLAFVGGVAAVLSYSQDSKNAKYARQLEAERLLSEITDLLAGRQGALTVVEGEAGALCSTSRAGKQTLELARRRIAQVEVLTPQSSDLYIVKGLYAKMSGDAASALNFYRMSMRVDSSAAASAYTNIGTTLRDLGQLHQAQIAFDSALVHDPKHASAFYNLGNTLRDLGDRPGSIRAFRNAIANNPQHSAAYHNMGEVLIDIGEEEDGLAAFRKSAEIYPTQVNSYIGIAEYLMSHGRANEAKDELRRALSNDSTAGDIYYNLVRILVAERSFDDAKETALTAVRLAPLSALSYFALGTVSASRNDPAAAESALRKAIELDPNIPQIYSLLMSVLEKEEKDEEAELVAQQLAQLTANGDRATAVPPQGLWERSRCR